MENASKALIMAGGVLIGIMLLSFMVLMLSKGGSISSEYDSQNADNQLVKFNSQFEIYDREDNTFFDIITVANLAYDVNKRNGYDDSNSVIVELCLENKNSVSHSIFPKKNLQKNYFFPGMNTNADKKNQVYMYDLIPKYGTKNEDGTYKYNFKCEGTKDAEKISYNQTTGKVKEIIFKAVKN